MNDATAPRDLLAKQYVDLAFSRPIACAGEVVSPSYFAPLVDVWQHFDRAAPPAPARRFVGSKGRFPLGSVFLAIV
jgi:hypothetical protein